MDMVHFIPSSQRRLAVLAAQADPAPVLIYGQSGTGRSALAHWIHTQGPRATLPFITANHSNSLVSQLIKAQGGTLLISEIGEWPLAEQKILLEFVRTKAIPHSSQNGTQMIVNTRIMCSTSQILEGRAQGGLFNSKLLQKLNVFRIEMPDLCKRQSEFEDIVTGILKEITHEIHREHIRGLSEAAWAGLKDYEWPGNLRELRNVLRIAIIRAQGDIIEKFNLPKFGKNRVDFRATREKFEKIYITELLKSFDWQLDRTCQESHLDKKVLMKKIEKYGIDLVSGQSSS